MLEVLERKGAELHESLLSTAMEPLSSTEPSASVVKVFVAMTVTVSGGSGHVNQNLYSAGGSSTCRKSSWELLSAWGEPRTCV